MNKPLSLIIEETKMKTMQVLNQVRHESGLPAYLFESIIANVLLRLREEKSVELQMDLYTMQQKQEENKEEGEK
ncbi:MAG: hypothetical protein Q4F03_04950 [Eubacteriales bacterium]|nr:hypothetical protein [Eubacteriales bacterium]